MPSIMKNQSISIIMPVFFEQNTAQNAYFLKRALESIRVQKFPSDYEIILIDDGSSPSICLSKNDYEDLVDKVTIIRLDSNQGLVNALNIGLKSAKYPLIARIDADDWWHPQKIEKQITCFLNDPDLTLVAGGMTRYDSDGNQIDIHIRSGEWVEILNFFIDIGCPFPHGSILAKKEIFELIGFYPHDARYIHCEDYALWGIWLRFFKVKMIEESLLNYTVWEYSVSHRYASQQNLASREVKDSFSANVIPKKLPLALVELSHFLGISLIDTGKLAYILWRYNFKVALPSEAIKILSSIIPDRIFISDNSSLVPKQWSDLIGVPGYQTSDDTVQSAGRYRGISPNNTLPTCSSIKSDLQHLLESMKLQFVIPAYKESPYLEECINSLLAQEARAEILICTSTPSAFLDAIAKKHNIPLVINTNSQQGIASDWNFAYQNATADLVVIAHQDDIYLPNFCQQAKAIFLENPQMGIAFTDCLELLEGQVMAWHSRGIVKKLIRELAFLGLRGTRNHVRLKTLLSFGNSISCPSVILNKKKLESFTFSSRFQINLDWEAWTQLAESNVMFGYIRKRLYIHRIHPESENQASLKDGRRLDEDLQMFGRFWPPWIVKLISALYRFGY